MDHLGRYEIIEQTGSGAMGNVYHARDTTLDREIALKTIRTGVDVAPEIRQRFYREARACARLQHPNIITVFDMGEVENTAYIAMELLKGADFRRIIQEQRPLGVETKLAACVEICEAIAHAHRHGVIHRDIKPSNLFLTNEGRTKVLDFGIARLSSSRLTVAGQTLGTPNYMAPEQILARPCDGRADLFSAAVVFFELLTFVHPFQGSYIPRRIVQGEPDSLFDHNASLPVILEKVFARGLSKDPCLRYQSGQEFAEDLRAVLDALRGNASPGFSGVQLPSERSSVLAPPPSRLQGADGVEAPDGQETQEWRLSEALRLLPEFESAVDQRDHARAQAVVLELEGRLAGDVRFMEALRLCRSRLGEMDLATLSMPGTSGQPPQSAPFVAGRAVPSSAVGQAQAGAAVTGSLDTVGASFVPSDSTTVDFPSLPSSPPARAHATGPAIPMPPPPIAPRVVRPKQERRKVVIIAGAIVVCAILVLVSGVAALRPVPLESSAATAVVRAASTNIYAEPARSAKIIASVPSGTRLNVLRLPSSRDQEWIGVQQVIPKVLRPGYVAAAELRDWHGQTGAAALAITRILDPGETGSDGAIQARIQELSNLASHFAGEAAGKEARLDIARSLVTLGQRHKTAGSAPADWQAEIKDARQQLDLIAGEANLQAQVLELTRQIDELLAVPLIDPAPVRTDSAPRPVALDVSASLAQARKLREEGDYTAAIALVERILRLSPTNKEALALRDKIRKAYDGEKK